MKGLIKVPSYRPRVVIIGLDGVSHDNLLISLLQNGYLRNMQSIFQSGRLGKMEVCIPEISSVSWTSFMTGEQSGEHGIYGFTDLLPGSYRMYFPNFSNLKKRTVFDDLGMKEKRSVVINLPSTYPSRSIPGVLISGFVAVDINKAVYPVSLIPTLKKIDYAIDIDTKNGRKDHDYLFQDLHRTLDKRLQIAEILWSQEDWDLFMVVVTGTDRLNHFLWNSWLDSEHPRHQDYIGYYQKVDEFVGEIYSRYMELPGSKNGLNHFIMLSDHGFTGIRSEVYLNKWLQENGFLSTAKNPLQSWEDIDSGSKAFAMDPSRIYIHDTFRYPNGCVAPSDAELIKEDIRNGLQELVCDKGKPIFRKILNREDVFRGPFLQRAPDLVLLSHHGFDLKGKLNSELIFDRSGLQGMHTQDDAFFFSDRSWGADNIFQIKDLILKSFQ